MTYVRPALNLGIYLDERGDPIPYGRRWGMDSPPVNTYSVTAHPERFAPLREVARALRTYLVATYEVDVDGDRIVPRDTNQASLTITETDFPMVRIAAGASHYEGAWLCECDACDEDVEIVAENLEQFAFAVAEGRLQERIVGRELHTSFGGEDGGSASMTPIKLVAKDVRAALKARGKGAVWEPWTRRGQELQV